jgi:MATE family multidrug resistance protein
VDDHVEPTRLSVLQRAWPIILANASVPLVGLADTAVIGHVGSIEGLGAIALGALVFSFVYWGFGFLRMATTGFVAQAHGAAREADVRAVTARGVLLGAALGVLVLALQWPIGAMSFALLSGSQDVEALALSYFRARVWGAPANLAGLALMGCLIGLGESRCVLLVQLVLNGLNVTLDVWLGALLGWGVRGIGYGTALAEWCACAFSLVLVLRLLKRRHTDAEPLLSWSRIGHLSEVRRSLGASGDIMVRTLFLVFGFAWFTDQSARFSDSVLAANHVLLQFLSFSAFFLDGFAYVAESLVGAAVGAGRLRRFDASVRRSTELASATAVVLALALYVFGAQLIDLITTQEPVREQARQFLPFASLYVACAFGAFQLDGIFIGATRTRDMRNASIVSLLIFVTLGWVLIPTWGNVGLWTAFIAYVVARAATLLRLLPRLRRSVSTS